MPQGVEHWIKSQGKTPLVSADRTLMPQGVEHLAALASNCMLLEPIVR